MKAPLRYVLIVLAILIIVAIALPFLVNANSFRPAVEEKLSAALGRQVHVGNLSFSIFSGALSAEDLSIADDPSFSKSPFLTTKSFKVGVEIWPLLTSKALNVTGLTIERPEVNLIRNPEGKWNFSTLATGAASKESSKSGPAPDFFVKQLNLENGRISIGSTASPKRDVYQDVNLEMSDVSLKSQFPAAVSARLPGGGTFKLDGRIGPLDATDASLTPLDARVAIAGLDLAKSGFMDPNSGVAGIVDVQNSLVSKGGRAHAEGDISMNKLQLVKAGGPSGVPVKVNFNLDYDMLNSAGTLNQGLVKLGQATARLTGTFNRKGEATLLNFKLDGQNMPVQDLQAALPAVGVNLPKGSSLQNGTLNANLNLQGPADKLVTTGNVGLFNAKLAGFDMGSKLSALSAFAGVPKGSGDTTIQKFTSNLRVAPDGIQTSNLEMIIPAIGQLNGAGTISSNNALNLKMVATLSAQSGVASTLGSLTGRTLSKNAKIPFMIQGTTADPKIVPDVSGMAAGMAQQQLGNILGGDNQQTKGLGEALGGLFGKKKKEKK
jgi:AsmA protein